MLPLNQQTSTMQTGKDCGLVDRAVNLTYGHPVGH